MNLGTENFKNLRFSHDYLEVLRNSKIKAKNSISIQSIPKITQNQKATKRKFLITTQKLPKFNFQKVSIRSQLNKSVLSNNFNKLRDLTERKNYLPLER